MAKRILIIDDEHDMRVYLRVLFTRAGYQVEVAQNGEEGLIKAKTFLPHLVTLDILMPKRSGVTAYQSLRESAETKHIPVIILSGLTSLQDLFREIKELPPPEAVIEKPIERESFLRRVTELIGGAE
jgi:DNA-binding response OmpR family regulator